MHIYRWVLETAVFVPKKEIMHLKSCSLQAIYIIKNWNFSQPKITEALSARESVLVNYMRR